MESSLRHCSSAAIPEIPEMSLTFAVNAFETAWLLQFWEQLSNIGDNGLSQAEFLKFSQTLCIYLKHFIDRSDSKIPIDKKHRLCQATPLRFRGTSLIHILRFMVSSFSVWQFLVKDENMLSSPVSQKCLRSLSVNGIPLYFTYSLFSTRVFSTRKLSRKHKTLRSSEIRSYRNATCTCQWHCWSLW